MNDIDFLEMSTVVEGESSQSSQSVFMSAILEAAGEDLSGEPELAGMEAMFDVGGEYGIAPPDSDNLHPFEDLADAMA